MILNTTQMQTLEAACNRLIPPDDYPGAWEAGVGDFILRLLETDARHQQIVYQVGLNALNSEATTRYGVAFASLTPEQQDAILQAVEENLVEAAWNISPPTFLNMLVQHTAEGYYSDPANGGNRGEKSWEMIGFA